MEKIKNYAIVILIIIVGVLAFIINCREPKVTKSVTYITTKGKITGATNATIASNGSVSASGSNLTIDTSSSIRDVQVYNYNTVYAGVNINTNLKTIYVSGEVSYANRDVEALIGYTPARSEIYASFKKSIISW